jgi:hypothetical protein
LKRATNFKKKTKYSFFYLQRDKRKKAKEGKQGGLRRKKRREKEEGK